MSFQTLFLEALRSTPADDGLSEGVFFLCARGNLERHDLRRVDFDEHVNAYKNNAVRVQANRVIWMASEYHPTPYAPPADVNGVALISQGSGHARSVGGAPSQSANVSPATAGKKQNSEAVLTPQRENGTPFDRAAWLAGWMAEKRARILSTEPWRATGCKFQTLDEVFASLPPENVIGDVYRVYEARAVRAVGVGA